MGTIAAPWFAEFVLISYRAVRKQHRPPLPSELLAVFVVFGAFSLIGESQPKIGSLLGWGVVLATALDVAPTFIAPRYSAASTTPDATLPTFNAGNGVRVQSAPLPAADTVKFA